MHSQIPTGLVSNDITVMAFCQLINFLIDLTKTYLSMMAVITAVSKCHIFPILFAHFALISMQHIFGFYFMFLCVYCVSVKADLTAAVVLRLG